MGMELQPIRTRNANTPSSEIDDLERAKMLFAERRARDRAAGEQADLFAEPGWDLLLALFIAYEEERCVEETQTGISTTIGAASIARWITTLIGRDMVARTVREGVRYVSLTDAGVAFMLRCLQAR